MPYCAHFSLGIGLPTLVPNEVSADRMLMLQLKKGTLGVFAYPAEANLDTDLINAGNETVTALPGAGYCDSATGFTTILGEKIDAVIP
jgi:3-oxoacid CoA-transferase subunit B